MVMNPGSIEAGERLERFGCKIVQTAGFYLRPFPDTRYANYTHGEVHTSLSGKFTADELRAMADYMDASK